MDAPSMVPHVSTKVTGAARVWFDSLPPGQIDSYEELADKFALHFSQQRRHRRDKAHIILCRHRDNESIEDYITRFNKEALQLGCSEESTRAAFLNGVKSDDLYRCLTGKDGIPKAWDDVIKTAKIFAQSEKAFRQPQRNNNNRGNNSNNNNKNK